MCIYIYILTYIYSYICIYLCICGLGCIYVFFAARGLSMVTKGFC